MASIKQIQQKLKKTNLTKIFFADLNGRIMNLPINPDNIESIILDGIGFDGSSVAGYATLDSSERLVVPDPAGNPYLQIATLIAMGIQGIEEDIDCGLPDIKSTYKKKFTRHVLDRRFLPKSMYEAAVEAEKSKFLKDFLGEWIYNVYMDLKINDWGDHRVHVSSRKLDRYLSI